MPVTMIWAMDKRRLIGKDNGMPWRLPSDMGYFKAMTQGKTVVMGRKTYESLGKALPNRRNIVLTRNPDWTVPDAEVMHNIESVLPLAAKEEMMVMGGAQIYREFLPYADKLLVTRIDAEFEGDEYFPPYDESLWELAGETEGPVDEKNRYPHRFQTYVRKEA
ncbi:dihydrofolate reductase [Paenibacillus melissococcoides]|uniref:Dihydrofolate reductase n=1 Tax=Paenibacillus melissococcoides TaxID=2912268 RepID=A0ABM9G5E2_9BACL|nr:MULTISPECIES: dihydrofolate reductase [Paenibacillus]MEB9897706.1 dihydrofolate reductase [Bacillus cereus]CAH8246786.1 dihydrofolate reductase [Paenibacillus melissococcoides]CAH8715751.1 dihydrofolate reductase [Paenibacillus melissococcoides]CAH8716708.1 dihydrofolate reductase [Paenibacillus melissococcoides]GIO77033.1 dihydrofolate reductase [Paenibacillus dendritiformis]